MSMTVGQGFLLASSSTSERENHHVHDHSVQFYDGEAYLLDELSPFIGGALQNGDAAIVIATPAHREALAERLAQSGINLALAETRGLYVALDAIDTLGQFMVDGQPDPE